MKYTLFSLVYILLFSQTIFSQVIPSYIPSEDLIAWYPFNGNANDESGNGNSGTVNGATLTTDKDGNENSAYSFDGVDDRISIPHSNSLAVSKITVSVWLKSNSLKSEQYVISKNYDPTPRVWSIRTNNPNNAELDLSLYSELLRSDGTLTGQLTDHTFNTGEYVHAVLSYDGTSIKQYLNGILSSEQEFIGDLYQSDEDVSIGYMPHDNLSVYGNFFNGTIDDIAIWNRALTEEEIQNVYHQMSTPYISGFTYKGERNGFEYFLYNEQMNWEEAKSISETNKGYLASIENEEENVFVSSFSPTEEYFIGYTDNITEGNFYWLDGSESTYTNWASNEPSNSGPSGDEDFVVINTSEAQSNRSDGYWSDIGPGEAWKRKFVMKRPIQSSKLSTRSLQVDSSYTKRGFKFSNYVSLDTLAASDSLISYQFDLDIPDGITYDSLRVFHTESTPSVTSNFVDGTLSVVTTGSGFITTYNPMLELFYTSDTTGTYSLTPTNVVLNTTTITNITSGVMKIDPFIKGDVDDSGVIQAYDASIILHQSVGSEILKPDPVKDWEVGPWFNWRDAAADVDEDGDILALDASYISQYVAGVITEYPTSTPQVESVIIEVTDRGLKITAPESIQALNIELPATEQVEFRDPEMSWNNSSVAMNKAEGMKLAVASSDQVSGEVMEIPLYVYTNDNITLEVTTVTNNTKKVHQVVVSGLTVNNEVTTGLPQQYILSQNYPNPFNPSTQIQYAVPEATQITLEVFNSLGQKVMDLVNGQKSAGYHTATFDASGLSSGVYLYKLTTPSFSQTNKMLLIK